VKVACVLRKSASFDERHVTWLRDQISRLHPEWEFVPFSDVPLDMPHRRLTSSLPSWWAKFEIYASDLDGAVLVMDLDTVMLRRWDKVPAGNYILRHFTRDGFGRPEEFAGCITLTHPEFRKRVSKHFGNAPAHFMTEAAGDDQRYWMKYWSREIKRFQDDCPDQFVSYKLHVLQHGLRPENVFINFHGTPRPWDVRADWIPAL
jgi:hypothetical protein